MLMSKGQRSFKMQPEKHEQNQNNVTFHCPSIACSVTLFEYPTFIGVSSTCDPNFLSRFAEVRDTVLNGNNGLFTSLVTRLMSKGQQRFKMQRPEKHEQYRNNVTFHCPSIACYVTLFEYPTFIGVSLTSKCDPNFVSRCAEVRDTVLEGISCIVKYFNWTANVTTPEGAYLAIHECRM